MTMYVLEDGEARQAQVGDTPTHTLLPLDAVQGLVEQVAELSAWKAEATGVLEAWYLVADAVELARPAPLGASRAEHALAFVADAAAHFGAHCAYPNVALPRDGKVGTAHPGTAQRAARAKPHALRWGSDRVEALRLLCLAGAAGLNAAELHAQAGTASRNQWATRLLELREDGLVEYLRVGDTYVERPTGPNATGRVQVPTPLGRRTMDNLILDTVRRGRPG